MTRTVSQPIAESVPGEDAGEVSARRAVRTSGRFLPPGGPHLVGSAKEVLSATYRLVRPQLRANEERPS